MITRLVMGDFKDRVRRPVYGVTLLAAAALGYVAVPPARSDWTIFNLGSYRGSYTSAYVGLLVALSSVIWLSLGGFYVIRGAIVRDEHTGVGQLLAATPLRNVAYLGAKLLSNILILASMLGVLALTSVVMQLARGESYRVDIVALIMPFAVLALPIMVMVAAVALAMETVRPSRAGLGNILWFFVWVVLAIGGQSPSAPLGGMGMGWVARSMPQVREEFSLGLMELDSRPHTFIWAGLPLVPALIVTRLAIALALVIGLIPALWFTRFTGPADFGRTKALAAPVPGCAGVGLQAGSIPAEAGSGGSAHVVARFGALLRTEPKRGNPLWRLVAGEFRVLTQRIPAWWALALVPFALVPGRLAAATLLVTWIVPVLIWSRLGTQARESGMDEILGAYPAPRLRLLAEWLAGVTLTALTGAPAALRLTANGPALFTWATACLFIPALALALGVLTGSPRPFQVLYLGVWWAILNGVAALDFMGIVNGHRPAPWLVAATALLLTTITFCVRELRPPRRRP